MRYENYLRILETRIGSIVGVCGGIDAMRKELYEPTPPEMFNDFYLPLRAVEQGYRVVFEEQAVLMEPALSAGADEWKMRLRVSIVSYGVLWNMRRLLNPLKTGLYAVQLLIHKVLRYAVGFMQLALLVSNYFLRDDHPGYAATWIIQLVAYAAAALQLISWKWEPLRKILSIPYYFCLVNGACVYAAFWFLLGKRYATWQPRKG
jgi:hypothetical protein